MAVPRIRSFVIFFLVLVLTAFCLNWLWEMLQMPAYAQMTGRPWRETVVTCTVATFGDVAITLAIYGVGALAAKRLSWGMETKWNVYVTAAVLGSVAAASIEWRALGAGRWSYTAQMPIVPLLGVGLWPFLQLTFLVPFSFWVAGWWARTSHREAVPDSTPR